MRVNSLADVTNADFLGQTPVLRVQGQTKPVFVGVAGGEGSYTQLAAQKYVTDRHIQLPTIECLTFVEDVLRKLEEGHIDVAIFGVVNSVGGLVAEYMPFIGRHRWEFVEVITFQVNHMLLALPGASFRDIRWIRSQKQALSQCQMLKESLSEEVEFLDYIDTAMAAQHLLDGTLPPDTAVIASEKCAELYGLDILKHNVQDKNPNITSFIVAQQCA